MRFAIEPSGTLILLGSEYFLQILLYLGSTCDFYQSIRQLWLTSCSSGYKNIPLKPKRRKVYISKWIVLLKLDEEMFRKIEIWILYLTLLFSVLFAVGFGVLVRQELVGNSKVAGCPVQR